MKTIAITIDEDVLARVDRLANSRSRRNRSRVIREAVREYVTQRESLAEDEREAGIEDGVPRESAIWCDFLTLMFKRSLTGFVASLSRAKQAEPKMALLHALQLDQ
jgi:predicted transcriptional regulator